MVVVGGCGCMNSRFCIDNDGKLHKDSQARILRGSMLCCGGGGGSGCGGCGGCCHFCINCVSLCRYVH